MTLRFPDSFLPPTSPGSISYFNFSVFGSFSPLTWPCSMLQGLFSCTGERIWSNGRGLGCLVVADGDSLALNEGMLPKEESFGVLIKIDLRKEYLEMVCVCMCVCV